MQIGIMAFWNFQSQFAVWEMDFHGWDGCFGDFPSVR